MTTEELEVLAECAYGLAKAQRVIIDASEKLDKEYDRLDLIESAVWTLATKHVPVRAFQAMVQQVMENENA